MKKQRNFDTERKIEVRGTSIQNSNKIATSDTEVKYQCPIKCRGEEVYDEQNLCPDSKMQMIPVGAGHIFY